MDKSCKMSTAKYNGLYIISTSAVHSITTISVLNDVHTALLMQMEGIVDCKPLSVLSDQAMVVVDCKGVTYGNPVSTVSSVDSVQGKNLVSIVSPVPNAPNIEITVDLVPDIACAVLDVHTVDNPVWQVCTCSGYNYLYVTVYSSVYDNVLGH